jgi:hypothetical protein
MRHPTPEFWGKIILAALVVALAFFIGEFVHFGKELQGVCETTHFFELHGKTYYCERVPQELDS